MLVAHKNRLTDMFITTRLANKDNIYFIRTVLVDTTSIKRLVSNSMYYDKIFIEFTLHYDWKVISSLLEYETDDVSIILSFDDLREARKTSSMLRKKNIKCADINIQTMNRIDVILYIRGLFASKFKGKITDRLLDNIYQYLYYKSNIDRELSVMLAFTSLSSVTQYLKKRKSINPSNVAYNLLMKRRQTEVGLFLLEYATSINYIHTILLNYTTKCLELYELFYTIDFQRFKLIELYTGTESISKKMTFSEVSRLYTVCLECGYKYLFDLNRALDEADTKFKKQIIILELI